MRKRFIIVAIIATVLLAVFFIVLVGKGSRTRGGVTTFGLFKVGNVLPFRPGDGTGWAYPYDKIPSSRFYVYIAEEKFWCVYESCGLNGSLIRTMGGYLEGRPLEQPDVASEFGFDDDAIWKKYQSILIVGDQNAKIVGIYPNSDMDDVLTILRFYPQLADFSSLEGVKEFGTLKVGDAAPLKPGDAEIPKGKKFYVYAFQQDLIEKGYCIFTACLQPGEVDYIQKLGGWYSSDGKFQTAKAFGLDPDKLSRGEVSLVVVTDKEGRIVAIHSGKTIRDILSILRQHPELADLSRL